MLEAVRGVAIRADLNKGLAVLSIVSEQLVVCHDGASVVFDRVQQEGDRERASTGSGRTWGRRGDVSGEHMELSG